MVSPTFMNLFFNEFSLEREKDMISSVVVITSATSLETHLKVFLDLAFKGYRIYVVYQMLLLILRLRFQ